MYHGDSVEGPMLGRAEALRRFPGVDPAVWEAADAVFPVAVTRSWADRIPAGSNAAEDPLGRQVLPDARELVPDPGDKADPVGESTHQPIPWVVRKHPDRVLIQVTRRCHVYCRYCCRRDQQGPLDPTGPELDAALATARASGAEEVILSGGDPLALSDGRLFRIVDALRPEVPVVRIHTRAPIALPERVTPALASGLAARAPVWVVVHCNHPRELAPDVDAALALLVDAGLPVLNQSVLLRGVNDDAGVLAELCRALVRRRVRPYYLHHPDPVPGNASFRLSTDEGLVLWRALAARVSGIALPRYVLDPADGSGKIDVRDLEV